LETIRIVIDSNDDLYVIDSNKLIKLTTANEIVWTIDFDFNLEGELFLNQNNEILVVVSDEEVEQIRKYSQLGELVETWNINDFNIASDHYIYVDAQENIYVTEWTANTFDSTNIIRDVKKFDSSGNLLKTYENMENMILMAKKLLNLENKSIVVVLEHFTKKLKQ